MEPRLRLEKFLSLTQDRWISKPALNLQSCWCLSNIGIDLLFILQTLKYMDSCNMSCSQARDSVFSQRVRPSKAGSWVPSGVQFLFVTPSGNTVDFEWL